MLKVPFRRMAQAERLTGMRTTTDQHMIAAAKRLLAQGPKAILLKGGHRSGDTISDLLVTGTGCTLGSAIATSLAQGMAIGSAVAPATEYVLYRLRLGNSE